LVIADARHDLELVLVDRREARIDALQRGIHVLTMDDRVTAIAAETDALGRLSEHRGAYAAVVCRGYGPPDETLTAARPFLSSGGILVVSEPPTRDDSRWPSATLERLGYSQPQYLQGIVMFHVEH
jgi:16S rRNA (guanine527-N7)-methyltransferase